MATIKAHTGTVMVWVFWSDDFCFYFVLSYCFLLLSSFFSPCPQSHVFVFLFLFCWIRPYLFLLILLFAFFCLWNTSYIIKAGFLFKPACLPASFCKPDRHDRIYESKADKSGDSHCSLWLTAAMATPCTQARFVSGIRLASDDVMSLLKPYTVEHSINRKLLNQSPSSSKTCVTCTLQNVTHTLIKEESAPTQPS